MKKLLLVLMLLLLPLSAAASQTTTEVVLSRDTAGVETVIHITPLGEELSDTAPSVIAKYTPPKIYVTWLFEVAHCLNVKVPAPKLYAALRFYAVNSVAFLANGEKSAFDAVTVASEGFFAFALPYVFKEDAVKHEFAHWLLFLQAGQYVPDHPKKTFQQDAARCGFRIG